MTTLPRQVAFEFCSLCNWAWYCWQFHAALFHENSREDELRPTAAGHALGRLSVMTQGYGMLEVSKLHDPAGTGDRTTLGIDYIVKHGGWSPTTQATLESLHGQLDGFAHKVLRGARNKSICHNDLASILAGKRLGAFDLKDGEEYFARLQQFAQLVWQEVTGDEFPFDENGAFEGKALIGAIGPADRIPRAETPIPR
ncbi:MAG: hypothetical protein JNK78_17330 [Planctomycetes bacterium]|nr:hypothetical protein [Planctomycetota bacterium]